MTLLELVDELGRRGVTIDLQPGDGPGPMIVMDGPEGIIDDELGAVIRRHREMIIALILCRRSGHVLAPCTGCGELSAVHTDRDTWPTCRITPRCSGRHQPRGCDVTAVTPSRRPRLRRQPKQPKIRRLFGPPQPYPTRPV